MPPVPNTEPIAAEVDPNIYGKSGDISKHVEGVKAQYDTEEKLAFYAQVMGDGTANIHFGKWDGVNLDEDGAYGKASEQMTDYMFDLATKLKSSEGKLSYVDLGSGTGPRHYVYVKNTLILIRPHVSIYVNIKMPRQRRRLPRWD